MNTLAYIDKKDYDESSTRIISNCVRSIIVVDNKIAMLYSKNFKVYLIPGGHIEEGETNEDALIREAMEEAGLIVKPSSIKEFGKITTIRKGIWEAEIYEEHASFYTCEIEDTYFEPDFTADEKRFDLEFGFVSIDEAISANEKAIQEGLNWLDGETHVLKLLKENHLINISE